MLQGQATRACPTDITGLLVSSLTVPITDPSAKPEKKEREVLPGDFLGLALDFGFFF